MHCCSSQSDNTTQLQVKLIFIYPCSGYQNFAISFHCANDFWTRIPAHNTSTSYLSLIDINGRCDVTLRELEILKVSSFFELLIGKFSNFRIFSDFSRKRMKLYPVIGELYPVYPASTRSIYLTKMYPPGTPKYPLTSLS